MQFSNSETDVVPTGLINRLSNGAFTLNPSGTISVSNSGGCFESWLAQTQSANIQTSQLSYPEDGQYTCARITQTNAIAQRFGIAQIIPASSSGDLREAFLSLSGRVRYSVIGTIGFAILQWSGTADAAPTSMVQTWGVSPSIENQFFTPGLSVVQQGVIVGNAQRFSDIPYTPIQAGSSLTNLILFLWTYAPASQGTTLDLGLIQLCRGTEQVEFEYRPIAVDQLIAEGTGGLQPIIFNSIAQAQAARIYAGAQSIVILGYYSAGDFGGGQYIPSTAGAGPGKFQSADGQWWVLSSPSPNVFMFGVRGDGSSDDSGSFVNAITFCSGKTLFIPDPPVKYLIGSSLGIVPANTRLQGSNKQTAQITRNFSGGYVLGLGSGVSLDNLYLEGNGGVYTGEGLNIAGTDGNQSVTSCRIIDFNGVPINFVATTAGSRSNWDNIETWQTNGASGSGNYAIVTADGAQAAAVPKRFAHIETSGFCSFSFGGSNDVFISDSFLADIAYSANASGVLIGNCRIANALSLTLLGSNHTLSGCDILPVVTLASGVTGCVVGPNTYNGGAVVDNSGTANNYVYEPTVAYTPTLSSGGTAPSLGNGSIQGEYTRQGQLITAIVNLTLGSTTSLGTGDIRFSLPQAPLGSIVQAAGSMVMSVSGTSYTAVAEIGGPLGYAFGNRDTSGAVTHNSPASFGAADTIRMTITYAL